MKIIEALKKVKELTKKADDLKVKISQHCADLDCETPLYPDQKGQVSSWMQSHSDTVKEISRLQYCIQKTNVSTKVSIELEGKHVEKSISEWLFRRVKGCIMEQLAWKSLTDRNLKEGMINQSNGAPLQIKIRRHYDPKQRDEKMFCLSEEPSLIDGKLEIVNCVTDLME